MQKNLFLGVIFLLLITTLAIFSSLYLTDGNLTYALHAPYIHFAMVKQLANSGILSVDGYSYASVSSSPLWLFLLTPFYIILSPKYFIWIALILNLIFQIVTIATIFKIVKRFTDKELNFFYAILIILMTPFIALTLGGLEHSLQIMLITLFLYNFIGYLLDQKDNKNILIMLILAPFIVAARYEDIAFIASVSLAIFLFFKDLRLSVKLFISSLILILLFGIWSDLNFNLGLLPTSITAKSTQHISRVDKFLTNVNFSHIIALIILNIAIFIATFKRDKRFTILTFIYLLTFFIHLTFAQVGWLYRYEAYLVTFGLINILLYIYSYKVDKKVLITLTALLILANYKQILFSPIKSVLSSKAVFQQQIQEGKFLSQFSDLYIATDNIGTIPFFAHDKILDIHGLSNPKIIQLKNSHNFNDKTKKALINKEKVDLIVAYKARFKDQYIDNYKKLATWKIKNKVLNGDDEIVFYARADKIGEIKTRLKKFSQNRLPKEVKVVWEK